MDETERGDRLGLILNANVRVLHRRLDVGMPGQFLRFRQRHAIPQQFGYVGVAAGGMEVGDAIFGLIGDAGPLQVFLDHHMRLAIAKPRKQLLARLQALEPAAQHRCQFGVQGKHVLLPVLGSRSRHSYGRRRHVEIEAARRETAKFLSPQTRQVCHQVNACPLLRTEALNADSARPGRCDQPGNFFGRQRPPCMPHIDGLIEPLDAKHGISQQTAGRNAPVAESTERLQVLVVGAMPGLLFLPARTQAFLHGFSVDVGQRLKPAPLDDAAHLAHRQLDVLRRVIAQAFLKFAKLLGNWDDPLSRDAIEAGINHARAAEPGLPL